MEIQIYKTKNIDRERREGKTDGRDKGGSLRNNISSRARHAALFGINKFTQTSQSATKDLVTVSLTLDNGNR